MKLTRREALVGAATVLGAGLAAPRSGFAATVAPEDRKFVFVLAKGGWDVVRVFAPVFSSTIERDRGDAIAREGSLTWVSNPNRPLVDAWWSRNADRMATLDGILVRSVNHRMCRRLWLNGTTTVEAPDWPTRIASAAADRYTVPHMVIEGIALGAEDELYTCLTGNGGQMESLLDASGLARSDLPTTLPSAAVEQLVDAFEQGEGDRVAALSPEHAVLLNAFSETQRRLAAFQQQTSALDLSGDSEFLVQARQALQYLGAGISRVATLKLPYDFDTHVNATDQVELLNDTFGDLLALDRLLSSAPGTVAPTLADETVVVVYSEMGRSPYVNSARGKDHWMYGSCLLWGPGVRGGTQVGGYDDHLVGIPVDLPSGELDPEHGVPVTPDVVGSTLLRLAGLDPAEELGADTSLDPIVLG